MSFASDRTERAQAGARLLQRAAVLGILGGALGVIAGVIEASVGAHIGDWIGNKNSPFPLGITTIALSIVALGAALLARRLPAGAASRLGVATALLVPGAVGFTTVGRLWYLPGTLLVIAGVLALIAAYRTRHLGRVLSRNWGRILLGILAGIYTLLGILAWDATTILALVGTAGIASTLAGVPRSPRWRGAVLVITAIPFAAMNWWSIVAPLAGVLIIAIGLPQVATPRRQAYIA